MKRKWLALLLSCTMVVNTGVLPVAATTLDNESAVVQQMNEETSDTQEEAEEGTLKAESNFEEIAEDGDVLTADLESDTYWTTEGEKARTFQLGEENNVNDVFDYAAIAEKTDTSKYQISEIDVTIGENTLKHKVDADNKEDKTTAEEISECFRDDFVIGEDADEENFIGEGKVSLAGTANEDVTIEVIFEKVEQIADSEPAKDPAQDDADVIEDEQPAEDTTEQAEERTLLSYFRVSGTSEDFTFDKTTGEAPAVYVATDTTYISARVYPTSGDKDTSMNLTYSYTGTDGKEYEKELTCRGYYERFEAPFLAKSGKGNVLHIKASKGDVTEEYNITVKRTASLQGLTVEDQNGNPIAIDPSFNKTKTAYTVNVLDNNKTVTVKAVDPVETEYPDESQILFNGKASEDGSYKVDVADILEDGTTLVMKPDNGAEQATEYTLTIKKVTAISMEVKLDPENAQFCLYNAKNERVYPDGGKYYLLPETDYTYTAACDGYVGKSGTINYKADDTAVLDISLEKAADGQDLPQLDAEYGGFRADSNNQSVISSKTPITKESIEVKWERQMGTSVTPSSGSTPVIVDNKVYTQSGGKLYMLDKETGEILKSSDCFMNAGFNLIPVTYGDGMIFVPLGGGIQCFNASTLESLWCYKGRTGSCNSPIRYENGRIYVGFQMGDFVCLTTTDEDPSSQDEMKTPLWTSPSSGNNGYWWAGAWTNDNYVFAVNQGGALMVMDKNTGATVQKIQTKADKVRSDVSFYNGRIYFSTQSGYLYSYNLTADGKVDLDNLIEPLYYGGQSTCTPAVYNNRLYIGISSGSTFGEDGAAILVADINPENGAMTKAYLVPTKSDFAYCQTSGLIINGYEDEDGYVYVYFLVNSAKGSLYMVKDKPGMTAPDPESGLFYTPSHEQYCIASAVADSDGTIYLKNDSAWQCAIRRAESYLKSVEVTGGNAVIDGGKDFAGSVKEHSVTVDMDTGSVTMNLTANEGTEIRMNGVPGEKQEIALTGDATTVEVELLKGESTRIYNFTIYRGPVLDSMEVTNNPNSGMGTKFTMDQTFDPANTEYTAGISTATKQVTDGYIWVSWADATDKLTAEAVSGVRGTPTIRTNYKGDTYVDVSFLERGVGVTTSATVKLTLTSEDGSRSRTYTVTLYTNNALPKVTLADDAVAERTDSTATVNVTTNKEGTLYYLVQKADAAAPDAETIEKDGKSIDAAEGENTLNIADLTKDGYKVYVMLKDANGAVSAVQSAELKELWIKGDLNDDGVVDLTDVSQLLDKITADEDVLLAVGDINGDGKIDLTDVSQLLDSVTAD